MQESVCTNDNIPSVCIMFKISYSNWRMFVNIIHKLGREMSPLIKSSFYFGFIEMRGICLTYPIYVYFNYHLKVIKIIFFPFSDFNLIRLFSNDKRDSCLPVRLYKLLYCNQNYKTGPHIHHPQIDNI